MTAPLLLEVIAPYFFAGMHPSAGTTGGIGCYSFHETKNISTGEGGAFFTNNAEYMGQNSPPPARGAATTTQNV